VTIDRCITNILALSNTLAQNVTQLFREPDIELHTDLCAGFKSDVSYLLTVLHDAFGNESPDDSPD
jgi:hypothetical protein